MYTKITAASARAATGTATALAGALACTLFASTVVASDHAVAVTLHVSTQGLDLSRRADVQTFYTRLQNAAWVACTRGDRVDLVPVDNLQACYENALGTAIRTAQMATLTQVYLETHTLQEATRHGIEVPAQVAAK